MEQFVYAPTLGELMEKIFFKVRSIRTSIDGTEFDAPLTLTVKVDGEIITAAAPVDDGQVINLLGKVGRPFAKIS